MEPQYKRAAGTWTMLFFSVSSIIGSGWLFSSYYSSQIAGPAALLSWAIAAFLTIIVAYTFAEVSTLFPVPGGSSHLPHITHGTMVSVILSWISWLGNAVMPAIETQAVLQYAAFFFPSLLVGTGPNPNALSMHGYIAATFIMLFFSVINIYSLKLLIRFSNLLAIWKTAVTLIVALGLMSLLFKSSNFTAFPGGFMPYGWHGVFAAISMGGIVFAFTGFKTVVEMAGEAANPRKSIPIALIGSILLCLLVYVLLQVAFIGALSPSDVAQGWSNLHFGGSSAGPFAALLASAGSVIILSLLYVNTIVAPTGAGLIYSTSSARILQAMGNNHQIPHFISVVNKSGIPVAAILINFIIGMVFFFPFPGWEQMVRFISSLMAFSYALGPVCLLVLRYQLPNRDRLFKIPFVKVWSFVAFTICALMCYWTGWEVIKRLVFFLIFATAFYLIYRCFSPRARRLKLQFMSSMWIWVFFTGLIIISYLGSFGGGINVLKFGFDFIAIGLLSLVTLYCAVRWKADPLWVQGKCDELLAHHRVKPVPPPVL